LKAFLQAEKSFMEPEALGDIAICVKSKNLIFFPGFRIRILIRINLSCWIRIRIQIADPDPDQGGRKLPTKIGKSTEF
jgi:hypothetical protein